MVPIEQGNEVHAPVAETKPSRDGVGSASCTPAASDGPLFVTVIVYVTFEPGLALVGPVFVTDRSAFWTTVELTVAVLLDANESGVDELTETVLLTVPEALAGTEYVDVIVAVAPAATLASVHGNAVVQAPLLETNVKPAGVASLTTTVVAFEGPLFV